MCFSCLVCRLHADWCATGVRCVQLGQRLHLENLMQREPAALASGPHIKGSVIIDSTAKIGENCMIGPDVSIGPGCVIGNGVRLANCVVMQGCQARPSSRLCLNLVFSCAA